MLDLPSFEVHRPTSAAEAARLAGALPNAVFLAGGTDLLPNLKHRLIDAEHLIAVDRLPELRGVELLEDGALRIGAATTLHELATSELIAREAPALAAAAAAIAGPQHRRAGTLGGNLLLDTRCLFYNQTPAWREALGHCLKREGSLCHVIGSTTTCVAAHSADTVPALMAMNAVADILRGDEALHVPVAELYAQDGRYALNPHPGRQALVLGVRIPPRAPGHRGVYRKVRAREAIDFPQLGLAVCASFSDEGVVTHLSAAMTALLPRPKVVERLKVAIGTKLEDAVIDKLSQAAWQQCKPQASIHGSPEWRREMARVEMRRALVALRG